ncbi:MAG TPA: hypothetical protein VH083_20635 [Myxococcales bacterium]|jgi:hypothetical protein|nr:hypothetical protein [Myxococcales bacterium]
MNLKVLCNEALTSVEGACAVAVIDLGSGEVLASAGAGALASPASLLLRADALAPFAALAGVSTSARGGEAHEVHISTAADDRLLRVVSVRQAVAVLTTERSANIALTWAQVRTVASRLEEAA